MMDINELLVQKNKGEALINIPITVQGKCGILTERVSNGCRLAGENGQQPVRVGMKTWKRNKGKENVGLDIENSLSRGKGALPVGTERQWQLKDELEVPLLDSQFSK